jgi:hypothetical protein
MSNQAEMSLILLAFATTMFLTGSLLGVIIKYLIKKGEK